MASTTEDAEAAAERLEAALERIAHLAAQPASQQSVPVTEVRDRLDRMIERLRTALEAKT